MNYYLGKVELKDKEKRLIIGEEIDKDQLDKLMEKLSVLTKYKSMKHSYDIAVKNAFELYNFLTKYNTDKVVNNINEKDIILEANRLTSNFCGSITIFLDITKRNLKDTDNYQKYEEFIRNMYDSHLEYRFWVRFRNYVVHYDIPFTNINKLENGGTSLKCDKNRLLKYSKWNKVAEDLNVMDRWVDISLYIHKFLVVLAQLKMYFVFCIAKEIIGAYEEYCDFAQKYKSIEFFIVKSNTEEDLKNGNIGITFLDFNCLLEAIKLLRRIPFVRLNFGTRKII